MLQWIYFSLNSRLAMLSSHLFLRGFIIFTTVKVLVRSEVVDHYDCKNDDYYFPIHEFVPMEVTDHVTYENFVENLNQVKETLYSNFTTLADGQIPPPKGSHFEVNDKFGYLQLVTRVAIVSQPGRIVKMDVEQQALTLVVHEALAWKDDSLQWPEDQQLAIEEVLLNASDIWTPPIYASHIVEEVELINTGLVNVFYDGVCIIQRSMEYTIPCLINVRDFPFDKHTCSFTYLQVKGLHQRTWISFLSKKVNTGRVSIHSTPEQYAHLEWTVINNSVSLTGDQCTGMEFSITVRRQANFYAIVLIFPTALLNILSLVVFTLPVDNTERENFCMTLMLTYFVLIMIIVDTIPPTGHQIPHFGLYVIICTVIVVVTFGMSMVLIEMHEHKRSKKKKMSKTLFWSLLKCCNFEKSFSLYFEKSSKYGAGSEDRRVNTDGCESNVRQESREDFKWKYLAIVLNRVFFVLTLIAHIVLAIAILVL